MTTPLAGWADADLQVYFTRTYSATSRTPTRYIPSATATPVPPPATSSAATTHHSEAGPIAGGVVGGVAFLGIVTAIVWLCLRRRRRRQPRTESEPQQSGPMTELPSPGSPAPQHKRDVSGSTVATVSPMGHSPPPPPFNASHWSQPNQAAQPAQPFYQPPPQAQQFYPPPPPPQRYEPPPSPISEMPSVRSPAARAAF